MDLLDAFLALTDAVPGIVWLLLLLVLVILYKRWENHSILKRIAAESGESIEETRELVRLAQEERRRKR